jgi:hypothetical protein
MLNRKHCLKAVHLIFVSSAETNRPLNSIIDSVNLHRPTTVSTVLLCRVELNRDPALALFSIPSPQLTDFIRLSGCSSP